MPFIHFSSHRLRKDANSEVTELTNKFNQIISALKLARQSDTHEIAKKLVEVEREKEAAQAALKSSQSTLLEQETTINALKEKLGIPTTVPV